MNVLVRSQTKKESRGLGRTIMSGVSEVWISKHLGCLVKIPEDYDAAKVFDPEVLLAANIPPVAWKGYTPNTVLDLARNDMVLLS